MNSWRLQNSTGRVLFKAHLTGTDTPATGKTIAVTLSKNGAAFGNPNAGASNATEIANGWYYFAPAAQDRDTLGPVVWRGTEGTIDPAETEEFVVDAVRAGLTALPNAAAGAAGGIPLPIWSGTLDAVANGSVTFPGGYGIDTHAQIVVELISGTNAAGKSRFATYSGAGNAWTVDKAWNADGETTPSGTVVARVFSVPAEPATSLPRVDVRQVGGTAQTAGDLAALIATLDTVADTIAARLTAARAGYLDNLNISGLVASSAEVGVIQNNTRCVRVVPAMLERPDSGSVAFRIELTLYDTAGNMEAPDAAPTLDVVNQAGTSRNANLDSTTMTLVSTGRYRATYTVDVAHAIEQLVFAFSVVEGGLTRVFVNPSLVVDTTAVDFTSADRTQLQALFGKLPSKAYLTGTNNADGDVEANEATGTPADSAGVGTLVSRLTAPRATALDNLDATVSSRATPAQVATELGTYDAPTKAELDAGLAAVTTTPMVESYSTAGGTLTPAQAMYEIHAMLSQFGKSGTTITVKQRDGVTTAIVLTVDDATAPTAISRSA